MPDLIVEENDLIIRFLSLLVIMTHEKIIDDGRLLIKKIENKMYLKFCPMFVFVNQQSQKSRDLHCPDTRVEMYYKPRTRKILTTGIFQK